MANRLVIGSLDNVAIISELPLVTTYSEADIREPDKRNTSYAKAVQLYGYNELNVLFENVFQLNIATQTFNPNLKTEASYYEDEILIFTGYLQLLRITLKGGNIIYDCNIIGDTGNFWTDIGDVFLTDLDFSDLDHTYNRDNVINSWNTSIIRNAASEAYAPGNGYYYSLVNRGTILGDETIWRVRDFIPSLYDYEILNKIFTAKGYTFESDFLELEFFKRQITYPNLDSVTLGQTELDNRQFKVGRSGNYTLFDADTQSPNTGFGSPIPFNNEAPPFFDTGSNYSGTTFTVPKNGTYNVSTKLKLKFSITHTNPSAVFSDSILCGANGTSTTGIYKNGVSVASLGLFAAAIFNTNTGLAFTFDNFKTNFETNTPFYTQLEISTGDLLLNQSDVMVVREILSLQFTRDGSNPVRFYDSGMALITTGSMHVNIEVVADNDNTMFYGLVTNKDVLEGDTIEMNNAVPVNIKQKDFIKSLMQKYFLIMQPDKTNPKKLIIEPYNDNTSGISYYDGEIINLGHRIDHKKEIVVNPMSELDAKTYIFKYKSDKDYYNKRYEETHNETFGTHREILENDFIKATKTNELIYSPTHNVANYNLGIAYPKIYDLDGSTVKRITPNIRSLYAEIKTTSASITFKEEGGSDLIIQYYGYAGHTDDPFNPTIDLNFGIPKQVYYSYINAQFTTNNLYNRFYKKFIDQISHRDSKLITAYLWLKKTDIENFSFRNRFFIEDEVIGDGYYRVNKIIEYVNESESVKCELLKLADVQVFTPTSEPISDAPGVATERLISTPLVTPSRNVSIYTEYPVNVVGSEDIVIGTDAQRISIVGSTGITIANGVTDVSVVNSSDIEITESNTSYVNGRRQGSTFKRFYGLLNQTGTSAPTITVNDTTFDGTIGSTYVSTGEYTLTSSGEFGTKIHLMILSLIDNNSLATIKKTDTNTLTINTYNASLTLTNGKLRDTPVEILVFD